MVNGYGHGAGENATAGSAPSSPGAPLRLVLLSGDAGSTCIGGAVAQRRWDTLVTGPQPPRAWHSRRSASPSAGASGGMAAGPGNPRSVSRGASEPWHEVSQSHASSIFIFSAFRGTRGPAMPHSSPGKERRARAEPQPCRTARLRPALGDGRTSTRHGPGCRRRVQAGGPHPQPRSTAPTLRVHSTGPGSETETAPGPRPPKTQSLAPNSPGTGRALRLGDAEGESGPVARGRGVCRGAGR